MPGRIITTHTAPLQPGDDGVADTLSVMHDMATAAAASSYLRSRARKIVDPLDPVGSLRRHVLRAVAFEEDPPGELVRSPERILGTYDAHGRAIGDCDDIATYAAALALAVGLPARFTVVGFAPHGPYAHVWTDVHDGIRWREIDTSRELQRAWRAPRRVAYVPLEAAP